MSVVVTILLLMANCEGNQNQRASGREVADAVQTRVD
jgi:hypothetical protein